MVDLAGLGEREGLEKLVEGTEAAREDHEPAGVLDEHHLADEEVAELDSQVDVVVERLLVRELDVAADREPAALLGAAVDRLHHSRPAAGDDREPAPGEGPPELHARPVEGVVAGRARGAEDRDRAAYLGERVKAFDELAQDAEDAPGIGVVGELLEDGAVQEGPVGGGARRGHDQAARAPPFRLSSHRGIHVITRLVGD